MRSKVIEKGWLEDDLKKAQKELKGAREYILAQELLIGELVSQIETTDEIQAHSELELHEMEGACRLAIETLQSYEQSIKNFGLLFGNGTRCISKLKEAIGEQELTSL